MILILSGDIELNPGPVDRNETKKEDFEVFNNKGLHFMYLNVNGLLNNLTNGAILLEAPMLQ